MIDLNIILTITIVSTVHFFIINPCIKWAIDKLFKIK